MQSKPQRKGHANSPFNFSIVFGPVSMFFVFLLALVFLLGFVEAIPLSHLKSNADKDKPVTSVKFVAGSEEEEQTAPEYFRTEHSLFQTDYDLSSWGVRNWDLEGNGRIGKGFIRMGDESSLWNLKAVDMENWEVNLQFQMKMHMISPESQSEEDDYTADEKEKEKEESDTTNEQRKDSSDLVFWYTHDKIMMDDQEETRQKNVVDFDFQGLAVSIHTNTSRNPSDSDSESSTYISAVVKELIKPEKKGEADSSSISSSSSSSTPVLNTITRMNGGCTINLLGKSKSSSNFSWLKIRYEQGNLTVFVDGGQKKKEGQSHSEKHDDEWVICFQMTNLHLPVDYYYGLSTFSSKIKNSDMIKKSKNVSELFYDIFTVTTYEIAHDEIEIKDDKNAKVEEENSEDSEAKQPEKEMESATSSSSTPSPTPKSRVKIGDKAAAARAIPVQIQLDKSHNQNQDENQNPNPRFRGKIEWSKKSGEFEPGEELEKEDSDSDSDSNSKGRPAFFRTKVYFLHLSILLAVVALIIFILTLYPKYPQHYHVYWRRF